MFRSEPGTILSERLEARGSVALTTVTNDERLAAKIGMVQLSNYNVMCSSNIWSNLRKTSIITPRRNS